MSEKKECVLYDRECIGCGECEICDLDPNKKCDNCGLCLETGEDYARISINGVIRTATKTPMRGVRPSRWKK